MASPPAAATALLALAATLALLAPARARQEDYCYHDETDRYVKFASKTAYDIVRSTQHTVDPPHCTPLQVWWLNRHGTRYPGKSTIREMEFLWNIRDTIYSNHIQEKAGRLCDADLEALRGWRLRINETVENRLTATGEEELFLTARRLRERFPDALKQPYSSARYQFRHTDTQRTEMSARKFAEGLFDNGAAVHIPPAEKQDMLLQPYTSCEAWLEGDKSDPPEWRALLQGSMMQALITNVSSRLGYGANLKYEDIDTMYAMCRFEKAWSVNIISPWCAVFSKDELKLLEYAEDLRYYYKSGYGDEKNVNLGCPLAKDLIERFKALDENEREQPAGVFYFAHSSTLHMLQARLGVYSDVTPLRANNYNQQRSRRWRISLMGSFAANLGAVFYKCSQRGEPETKHVLFLAGEGPLDVQGCNVGLCSWEHVKHMLEPLAQQCDLKWCSGNGSTRIQLSPWTTLLLAVFATLVNAQLKRAV